MRVLAAVGLLIWYGCHSPVSAGLFDGPGWRWEERIDPITDKARWAAVVFSAPGIGVDVPAAAISLHCIDGTPAIYFQWDAKVITKTDWLIEYRFAGELGHRLDARYVNRSAQIVTGPADINRFLGEALRSSSLLVRVSSNAYGGAEATFGTSGGPEMVARLVEACPRAAPQ